MQAYFIGGPCHGRVASFTPRDDGTGPIRSGYVPPTVLVEHNGDMQRYVLASSTGDRVGSWGEADLYYTPEGMTDDERNEAVATFIRVTAPWQVQELSPDTFHFA